MTQQESNFFFLIRALAIAIVEHFPSIMGRGSDARFLHVQLGALQERNPKLGTPIFMMGSSIPDIALEGGRHFYIMSNKQTCPLFQRDMHLSSRLFILHKGSQCFYSHDIPKTQETLGGNSHNPVIFLFEDKYWSHLPPFS